VRITKFRHSYLLVEESDARVLLDRPLGMGGVDSP
jgi:hypothetical protein